MRLSLDTHILLWAVTGDVRLPAELSALLTDLDNEVHVSAVCVWEAAIKAGLGRLPGLDVHDLVDAIRQSGFSELSVSARHAAGVVELDPLHRDPFDRLLVAQALEEDLTLVTLDEELRRYPGVRFMP